MLLVCAYQKKQKQKIISFYAFLKSREGNTSPTSKCNKRERIFILKFSNHFLPTQLQFYP